MLLSKAEERILSFGATVRRIPRGWTSHWHIYTLPNGGGMTLKTRPSGEIGRCDYVCHDGSHDDRVSPMIALATIAGMRWQHASGLELWQEFRSPRKYTPVLCWDYAMRCGGRTEDSEAIRMAWDVMRGRTPAAILLDWLSERDSALLTAREHVIQESAL